MRFESLHTTNFAAVRHSITYHNPIKLMAWFGLPTLEDLDLILGKVVIGSRKRGYGG